MTTAPDICETCQRPYARTYEEWKSGFPPATATHGDFCGLDLPRAECNDTSLLEANCYEAAWSNALTHQRATQQTLEELHGYVAEMCEFLGANAEEQPCDAWLLRDLIVQQRGKLERAHAVVEALETLHTQLQVRFSFMHGGVHWKENTLDPTSIVLLAAKICVPKVTP